MEKRKKPGFRRLLEIAGQKKIKLVLSACLAVLSAGFSLTPYVMIYLIAVELLDPAFGPDSYSHILKLAVYALGGIMARYLLYFISTMISHVAAYDILYGLRSTLAKHLGGLPMGYFTGNRTGKIKKIIFEDVEEIEQFIAHHIPDLVAAMALPVLTVAYLFFTDARMALAALIPLPFALLLQRLAFGSSKRGNVMVNYHNALEAMNGTIVEYVRGMPVVKVFNQDVDSFSRLKRDVYAYRDLVNLRTKQIGPPWAIFTVLTSASLCTILPFGVYFYLQGTLPLPILLLFLMLGAGYMAPMVKVAMMGGTLSSIFESVARIDGILEQQWLRSPVSGKSPSGYTIEFDNLSFGYGENLVFDNLCFSIDQGSVTALVGPSGAGKSTIAHLLLRMWEPLGGRILVGGKNIRDIPQEELMNLIGFVSQDIFIFTDTIYENIRMGLEGVTDQEIFAAARAAQCHEFIKNLKDGYQTIIGEGGKVHLSGGERQRISIARIFLKKPPIILLDEATAYADAENESKIQEAFGRIMKGKTVIIIAHRLSTIADVDNILVINKGRVAEQGNCQSLLEKGTLFSDMWKAHGAARNWTFGRSGEKTC